MKNLCQSLLLLGCFSLAISTNTHACGYAWISDCASQVQLRINGTLDSFDIAACPAGFNFDGIQLGNVQSLSLANAKTITWESCQNNVSTVFLKYRVYPQGSNPGSWQSLTLQQYFQTIEGPYTTRYNSAPGNISLTNGLVVGQSYLLEVYFLAEVDTIGDDFIPETTLLKNNDGANYKMSFTYGGPAAPPILLLPHLTEPSCNGANDGNIYVSAYGNINGLFYAWSNISLNFFQQFNLAAGNYGITVSNPGGQTASATMALGQPEPLSAGFSNVRALGCNNSSGFAQAVVTGGTAPYHYLWQTGQQTDTASFTASGNWQVTVTDAHQCSQIAAVFIGNDGITEQNIVATICAGETYTLAGQSFSAAGDYNFTIPGPNGCDTLMHLMIQVLNPPSAQVTGTFYTGCDGSLQPAWLVAHTDAGMPAFVWTYNGNVISTGDSCFFQITEFQGGMPVWPMLSITDEHGCVNNMPGFNPILVQVPLLAVETTVVPASSSTSATGSISLVVLGGTAPFTYSWDNGASTQQITGLLPGAYCVTVTDSKGCTEIKCLVVSALSATYTPDNPVLQVFPNPVSAGSWVHVRLPENLPGKILLLEKINAQGSVLSREALNGLFSDQISLKIPADYKQSSLILRLLGSDQSYVAKIMIQNR